MKVRYVAAFVALALVLPADSAELSTASSVETGCDRGRKWLGRRLGHVGQRITAMRPKAL